MAGLPESQKAWVYKISGPPAEVLKLEESYPLPVPNDNELLIKVRASGINAISWKLMADFPFSLLQKKPCTPECDFSGEIVGGNLEGTEFKIGDCVFGTSGPEAVMASGTGTLAQYTVTSPTLVGKKPEAMSWQDSSSLPIALLTAFHNLITEGGLVKGAGQKVFINGGSGGVGTMAIQLAKAYGAYVVTTASPSSTALVKSLGADEVIDYRAVDLPVYLSENFGEEDKKFDILVDTQGVSTLYYASPAFLKPTSTYLDTVGGPLNSILAAVTLVGTLISRAWLPVILGGVPRKYKFTQMPVNSEHFKEGLALIKEGKIRPVVDKVFIFEDVLEAYAYGMSGRAKGKIVIRVDC